MQSQPENIRENSWWPVVQFILILAASSFIFYIPVFIAFSDFFKGPRQELNNPIGDQFWFRLTGKAVELAAALFTTWAIAVRSENSTLATFGLSVRVKNLLSGFALGAVVMLVFTLIGFSFGLVQFSFYQFEETFFKGFFIFFFVACSEEVIIRGYLLFKLKSKLGSFWALLITSSFFGLMHFFNNDFTWAGCANISLSGFLMGLIVLRTGTISSAIGVHWAWNFVQGSVFGFAVSGNIIPGILRPESGANHMLMGGDFGAEGSILLVPVTLLFIMLVYTYWKPENTRIPA